MKQPRTLQEAIIHFASPEYCLAYMVAHRWPDGVECPTCGRKDAKFLTVQRKWQCKSVHPKRQFTAKAGTVFEDSPLGLEKWLPASWMLANCKNGISSYELARALGVTQKTAWFMLHRIRLAMKSGSFMKMGGSGSPVEADETYIGGKLKNMHADKRRAYGKKRGTVGKTAVVGILERGGHVRATVVPDTRQRLMHALVKASVESGAELMTDEAIMYYGLDKEFVHQVVNHMERYVDGKVHTNGIENFWSLLKRGLTGTYIAVEPFHLDRYVDEQVFRYNNRNNKTDAGRFSAVLSQVAGKRLTYAEVTGKVGAAATN